MLNWKKITTLPVFLFILFYCMLIQAAETKPENLLPNEITSETNIIQTAPSGYKELLLTVFVNKIKRPEIEYFLQDSQDVILARVAFLKKLGLVLPERIPLTFEGKSFMPLSWLKDVSYQVNSTDLSIAITVKGSAFRGSGTIDANKKIIGKLRPEVRGGYINYDVNWVFGPEADQPHVVSGIPELTIFNHFGVGRTAFLAQNTIGKQPFIRLETNWVLDRPESMTTLQLGDSFSRSGAWGSSLRFGGVRYGTNFDTQPRFVTFPLPGFSGSAALPSNVDLIINNVRRFTQPVKPGPFSIENLPFLTGSGEAFVIVKDLLGRERVIEIPYYITTNLLAKGLSDYSIEFGATREDFAIKSNNYRRIMLSGTYRHGITDNFTGEVHGEFITRRQAIGLNAVYLLNHFVVTSASVAFSQNELGQGVLGEFSLQRQAYRYNIGGRLRITSSNYADLGQARGERAPRVELQSILGLNLNRLGSLTVGNILRQDRNEGGKIHLINTSYTVQIGKRLFFTTNGVIDTKNGKNNSVLLTVNFIVDQTKTASVSQILQQAANQTRASLSKYIPPGPGYGYQLFVDNGKRTKEFSGRYVLKRDYGTYETTARHSNNVNTYSLNASGSLISFADHLFLSRLINGSFSLVEIPDIKDVRVYLWNQFVGKTNKKGHLLIPDLLPYFANNILINSKDIPFDARIDVPLKQQIIPYFRSGAFAKFAIERKREALISIFLPNGVTPIPAGALVHIEGKEELVPVGDKGEVFISGLEEQSKLIVEWGTQICDVNITYKAGTEDEIIPDLGKVTCENVRTNPKVFDEPPLTILQNTTELNASVNSIIPKQ